MLAWVCCQTCSALKYKLASSCAQYHGAIFNVRAVLFHGVTPAGIPSIGKVTAHHDAARPPQAALQQDPALLLSSQVLILSEFQAGMTLPDYVLGLHSTSELLDRPVSDRERH